MSYQSILRMTLHFTPFMSKNITDKDVALLSLRCQTFCLTDLTTAIQAVIAIYTLSTEASDTVTNQAE